jgi:AraC family transcriptional regulator of adaptative response/methylated-DNA-[protein]-cysteine methyltransferase
MEEAMIDAESAWQAFTRRDRAFDGQFVIGVLTTGIYCRPSCAARHALRANVRFFANGAEARAAISSSRASARPTSMTARSASC